MTDIYRTVADVSEDRVRVYFGGAAGSAWKALSTMEEKHILHSYVSQERTYHEDVEEVFIDSGGYSLMIQKGQHGSVESYLDYIEGNRADLFAIQDYPCEPEILSEYGRSVSEHQRMTTQKARECLQETDDRGISAEVITVVQGWYKHQYLEHIDSLRDEGLLTPTVGVGSVCRRASVPEIINILSSIREALPSKYNIHAFGVKLNILSSGRAVDAVDSVDTSAWYQRAYKRKPPDLELWKQLVYDYLSYVRRLNDRVENTSEPSKSIAEW